MPGRIRLAAFLPLTPVAFEILITLAGGEQHGYAIMLEVERRTGGAISLHAGSLYRALKRLLESGLEGPVNVGTGNALPVRDLIVGIGKQLGRPELIRLGARPLPAGEPEELFADVSRLQGELGFRARTPLEQGLAACVGYWRRHG